MDNYFVFDEEVNAAPVPLFAASGIEEVRGADQLLEDLHTEYSHKLYNYTLSILRSREDAEDAVQTTFMNAFGSIQAGRVPRQEASWLFRIAKNVCLNRIRTQQRKPSHTIDGIDVASLHTVEDVLDQKLHVVALRRALDNLPEQQRTAIVMRELQGASYTEIAEAMHTTQGAVESLIFRARKHLATAMAANQLESSAEFGMAA